MRSSTMVLAAIAATLLVSVSASDLDLRRNLLQSCGTGCSVCTSGGFCRTCMKNYGQPDHGGTCELCNVKCGGNPDESRCKQGSGYAPPYCNTCGNGYGGPGSGNGYCTACDVGTYSVRNTQTKASTCTDCPAGTYADKPMSSACTQCPAGTYSGSTKNDDVSDCTPCPANTYSTKLGQTTDATCQKCPMGYTSPAGSTMATACTCPTGSYQLDPTAGAKDGNCVACKCCGNPCQDKTGECTCPVTPGR